MLDIQFLYIVSSLSFQDLRFACAIHTFFLVDWYSIWKFYDILHSFFLLSFDFSSFSPV